MFAVLLLPQVCLQAALRFRPELWTEPVAIVEEGSAKGIVLDVTAPAAKAGVEAGLTSPQALARCESLRLLPRAQEQERVVTGMLLETGGSLSPHLEETAAGICTVDVRTVKVPDWRAWAQSIFTRLQALELRAQIGVAANPDLALLAARRAAPVLVVQDSLAFLAGLTVAEVEPPKELLTVLEDWGIRNLGELTELGQGNLVERLGLPAENLWQCASGTAHRLLRLARVPEVFEEAFDFDYEIDTVQPLLFMLRRFLEQLTLRLREAGRVAGQMVLTLPLEDGALHDRSFTIPAPTADVETLFRILDTHLETLQLDQRPRGLRLRMEPALPQNQQLHLFEAALRDPNRFGETLARLAALVGTHNVGVPVPADTHRPDQFQLMEPRFQDDAGEPAPPPVSHATGLPLRRFRPAFAAQVHVSRHRPAYVVSDKVQGPVSGALGPYRLSGHWWDGDGWQREEWDIEVARQGMFRLSCHGEGIWFVEGCYDDELALR